MAETARKPFNLKEALEGKPVVTRDGRKVFSVAHLPQFPGPHTVAVSIQTSPDYGMGYYVDTDGCVNHLAQVESRLDLFMEAVEKEAWVNLYPDGVGGAFRSVYYQHESEQAADRRAEKDAPARLGGKAHRITWTE